MPNEAWKTWRIIAKADPDKPLSSDQLETLTESGVDAVVIGGTQGITPEKVARTWELLSRTGLPLALEVSTLNAIQPESPLFLIPVALNTLDGTWITGAHQAVAHRLSGSLDWSRVLGEGYILMNPNSAAARVTSARTALTPGEAAAYAEIGAHLLRLPIIYLEYSGAFGSPDVVRACREATHGSGSRLFYGGGITQAEQAAVMAPLADTLVVGNLVQSEQHRELIQVVRATRQVAGPRP